MGEPGLATRVLAGRFGSSWTYAGRACATSASSTRAVARSTTTASGRSPTSTDALRPRRSAGRALGVAGDAQRRVPRGAASTRSTCRCRRPSADDFVTFARALGLSGASVTIPLKVVAVRPRRRGRTRSRAASAPSTPSASSDGRWIGGNTDASGFLRAAARSRAARRAARVGSRRRRRGARGGGRARLERLLGARARAQPRSRPRTSAMLTSVARRAVAARAGQLGSAGQLHAGRHVPARRRDAAPGAST